MPTTTLANPPGTAALIAELMTAAAPYMITTIIALHHDPALRATLPVALGRKIEDILRTLIFWTVHPLVILPLARRAGTALAGRASRRVAVGDVCSGWDKGRAVRFVAVCSVGCSKLDVLGLEGLDHALGEHLLRPVNGDGLAAAPGREDGHIG